MFSLSFSIKPSSKNFLYSLLRTDSSLKFGSFLSIRLLMAGAYIMGRNNLKISRFTYLMVMPLLSAITRA